MTIVKAVVSVCVTAVLFGTVGALLGYALGRFTPSFYRQVLNVRDATISPEELGLGLGLTNGLVWGMVVGMVLVLIVAWRETRLAR